MSDQKSNILKYINIVFRYCYYSLFALTPLIMMSVTSELFEFNKMIFIYLVSFLVLTLWIMKMIVVNKIIIKKTPLDIPILFFFFSQLLSTVFSIDRHTSFFGYYGRFNGGLLSMASFLVLYCGMTANRQDFPGGFLANNLKITIFTSLAVILWGLPGRFGHDLSCLLFTGRFDNACWTAQFRPAERLFSTLGQPNWLGAYLAIGFFIGLYFYFKAKDVKYFMLNTGYLMLNFATVLFTRSRSTMLAVFIGLILAFVFILYDLRYDSASAEASTDKRDQSRNLKKLILLLISLTTLTIIFKTGIPMIDRLINIQTYIKSSKPAKTVTNKKTTRSSLPTFNPDVTESGDIRKIVWQGAIDLGKKYPVFGTGVETFAYAYYFVRPKEHNLTSEWDYLYNKAHNEYLNYFATTGFIGVGSYLIMIGVVLCLFISNIKYQKSKISFDEFKIPMIPSKVEGHIKNKKDKTNLTMKQFNNEPILLICLLISYLTILITNFFGFSTTTINLYFYLIPALMIMAGGQRLASNDENDFNRLSSLQIFGFAVAILFFIYGVVYFARYWLADVNYAQGESYSKISNYQAAINYFDQALKSKYEHVYQDKLSFALANFAFITSYQKQDEAGRQLVKLADYYNMASIRASPKNNLYWKTRAKNFYLFYQISADGQDLKQGVDALNQAKLLSPTDPKIPYSLTIFYSLLADREKDQSIKKQFESRALNESQRAMDLKPNDRGYFLLYGQLLKKYGNLVEARKIFQYILDKISPADEETQKELLSL